jgi:hypothetical protein
MKTNVLLSICISLVPLLSHAQQPDSEALSNYLLDSLYIQEVEGRKTPVKILHAEPLYVDLIRDLGARKGEKEWNVGLGLTDNNLYDSYEALVEYEFAPIDRLGLEIELPFTFYYRNDNSAGAVPSSRLNSLKLAAQWSFFVSEKTSTTLALGYLHEFEMTGFSNYGKESLFEGNLFNPFFIAAKRWGQNFHTLVYTGPSVSKHFRTDNWNTTMEVHSNIHYMIPGTRNFIGVEFNKEFRTGDFDMVIRPQMRVSITDRLLVGIVTGISVKRENERFSSFIRLIYEPGH